MEWNGVNAVVFDMGNTILQHYPSRGHSYCKILHQYEEFKNIDIEILNDEWELVLREWYDVLKRRASITTTPKMSEEFWSRFNAHLLSRLIGRGNTGNGVAMDYSTWSESRSDYNKDEQRLYSIGKEIFNSIWSDETLWKVFDDAESTVTALRERGFKIGIVSNWDSRLRSILDSKGIRHLFDAIAISTEVGVEKPDGKIFQRCAELLNISVGTIIHVGDEMIADGVGALQAGCKSCFIVDRNDKQADFKETHPELKGFVERIHELREILATLE